jgi:hypothetical protein
MVMVTPGEVGFVGGLVVVTAELPSFLLQDAKNNRIQVTDRAK